MWRISVSLFLLVGCARVQVGDVEVRAAGSVGLRMEADVRNKSSREMILSRGRITASTEAGVAATYLLHRAETIRPRWQGRVQLFWRGADRDAATLYVLQKKADSLWVEGSLTVSGRDLKFKKRKLSEL